MLGPVFGREATTMPRRPRHFVVRSVYVLGLLLLICTAWLRVTGTQIILTVGDMARFGTILFQIMSVLQLTLVIFFAAMVAASNVSLEKDRRTLILLLLTRMTNTELVLGKLSASLLSIFFLLAAAAPVFMLTTLFGGVSFAQVARVFAVTVVSALAAGSLGSTLAFWREKTFQTLSITALTLVIWFGVWEAVHVGLRDVSIAGLDGQTWATICSPFRAILVAAHPALDAGGATDLWGDAVTWFVLFALGVTVVLNVIAIARVRVWNPSREVRPGQAMQEDQASIWGVAHDLEVGESMDAAERARAEHVDARAARASVASREVWDNPILWREMCTWAYGRKVLIIRLTYLVLFALAWGALHWTVRAELAAGPQDEFATILPAATAPLALFCLVSLVVLNALAVTSITNERDGQALDLLLVTDLSPFEFVAGKLGGVLWVTKEMVVLPMLLGIYLWWFGILTLENLVFLLGGLMVMNLFIATLGIHCGMMYANSRSAIGASLGTVFFLFLGVSACMIMMVKFSSSFQNQLAPFLAAILGGGVGLYVALGWRNPSPAITLASLSLPFATFFAITSFLLRNQELTVFLVVSVAYGFAAAAMLVPAVYEFDIAMGRTRMANDED
ncbi:MAG: ABC transporter permease [Pirellulaceae bacterium]|nr:ABC transporter permease [Pirellulaceae bacterium]